MAATNVIPRETLSTRVYARLREEILNGHIAQGERLSENGIAGRLGVSATPVREAIRLLSGEGLVEYVDRKGVRVISLQEREILQCFSIRNALERLALKEAFPLMTREDKRELSALAARTAEAQGKPPGVLFELDREFHALFIEKAGNMWLTEFSHRMSNALTIARLALFNQPDIAKVTEEHLGIARAVQSGDLPLADHLLDHHIQRVCANAIAAHRQTRSETTGPTATEKGES